MYSEEKHPEHTGIPEELNPDSRDHVYTLIRDNERLTAHIAQLTEQLTSAMRLLEHTQNNQQQHSAASRLKLPTPPKFNGRRGDNETPAEEWIFLVEQHIHAQERKVTETQAVIFVGSLLTDLAASWYLSYCTSQGNEAYQYAHFRECFLNEFQDKLVARRSRDRLRELKQGNRPIEEYVSEFRSILRQIKDMNPPDQIHAFVHGLQDHHVQQEVEVRNPKLLDEAIVIASTYSSHRNRTRPRKHEDRMELDALSLDCPEDVVLELAAAIFGRKSSGNSYGPRYKKLSAKQRAFLVKTNGCFYCRKPNADHVARDCPLKSGKEHGQ